MARDILKQVRIAAPCPASWNAMKGDDRVRFCEQCRLNVYNLSEMRPAEARALLEAHEGKRLCGRIYQRRDGTFLTRNCPPAIAAVRRRLAYAIGLVAVMAFGSFSIARAKINKAEDDEYPESFVDRARNLPGVGSLIDYLSPRATAGAIAMPVYTPSSSSPPVGSTSGPAKP